MIEGELLDFFETGSEGVMWAVDDGQQNGYDSVHFLKEGDTLTIYSVVGTELWSGVIKPDRKTGYRPYPRNPEYGQQCACGYWVHWIQEGFTPDEWGSMFLHNDPRLRARLVRAGA